MSIKASRALQTTRLQRAQRWQQVARHAHHITSATSGYIARRDLLLASSALLGFSLLHPEPSAASLVRFPADELNNRYFLVRAGESYAESRNECLSNPVWKTSGRHGLSDLGKQQVLKGTTQALEQLGLASESAWIWPSITQNAYQTAELLAYAMGLGRSRIVPEYSFLDSRGLGALELLPLDSALAQVASGDALDANFKPRPGTDGTPNESLQDVLVRMRQLLSITETQYFGADVVVVAPDSDTLSVLQAAVLGRDLRAHREFSFRPGEARALVLSAVGFDVKPLAFTCPDPPKCTQAGAERKPFTLLP